MDAATASDSVTYKPEVGQVAGSSPTSRSVLFLLFILSSLFFLSSSVSSPSGFWQFLLLVNTIFFLFFSPSSFWQFFFDTGGGLDWIVTEHIQREVGPINDEKVKTIRVTARYYVPSPQDKALQDSISTRQKH